MRSCIESVFEATFLEVLVLPTSLAWPGFANVARWACVTASLVKDFFLLAGTSVVCGEWAGD